MVNKDFIYIVGVVVVLFALIFLVAMSIRVYFMLSEAIEKRKESPRIRLKDSHQIKGWIVIK